MTANSLRALTAVGCAVAALTWAAAPALAQSKWDALYDRIIRLEHQIRDMNTGAAGPGVPAGSSSLGDSGYRMGVIEEQLRQIAGQMQELHRAQQALEFRLDRLEGGPQRSSEQPTGFERQQAQMPQPQWPQVNTGNARDIARLPGESDVAVEPQTSGGPQVLGTIAASQLNTQSTTAPTSGEGIGSLVPEAVEQAALDGGATQPGGAAPSGDAPEALYGNAYDSLLGRRFGAAEAGFKLFLDRHDRHPLAGDAQYWLGETYYAQRDYKQAAQSFLKGYRSYPKGRKAPDTLLKLAISLQQLGQKPQACSTFAEVTKQYPTAANVRNEAIKEMKRAGC